MYSILQVSDDTDALGPELITLEALKLELGITDDDDDEQLEAAITRYSNLISDYLGVRLGFANVVETFYFEQFEFSRWGAALALSLYPVVDLASVTMNGSPVDETSYSLDPTTGMLRLLGGPWSGTIVVTYSGGHDIPGDTPSWLSSAVIESIRADRSDADSDGSSISSTTHGDTRVTYFQNSSSDTRSGLRLSAIDYLRPHRRPAIA